MSEKNKTDCYILIVYFSLEEHEEIGYDYGYFDSVMRNKVRELTKEQSLKIEKIASGFTEREKVQWKL